MGEIRIVLDLTAEYYINFELFQARSWGGWKAWGFRGFQPLSWETPRGRERSAAFHAATSRGQQCPPSLAEAGRGGAGLRALDPPGDQEFLAGCPAKGKGRHILRNANPGVF